MVLLAVSASGILLFLFQFPPPHRPAVEARALKAMPTNPGTQRPVLVIGIDGGTWSTLQPLLDQKRLPALASIIEDGVRGDMNALWPPYWSVAAWAAITTGHPRRDTGVYGDVQVKISGLPVFQSPLVLDPALVPITAIEYLLARRNMIHTKIPDRTSLKRPPVWEMLDRSGIKTGVVRFNFSYPATKQAAIVVSNLAMVDVWGLVGVRIPDSAGLVQPVLRRDELLAPFAREWKGDSSELRRLLPEENWPKPKDAALDPVSTLRGALHFDAATMVTALKLMHTDPDIRVLFVHLGGVDNIEHSFWQYRFPGEFKRRPDEKDIAVLGPVIDRYLEFIDAGIRRMIDAFPEKPNVLIVSDHGQGAREDGVPFKGWHASPGIFLAAGPDIAHNARRLNVSYYDVVPTILDLESLEKPDHLRGASLFAPSIDGALKSLR
jgi:predicted AlkP superfamily phosphohydrolase/phosphomutase